MKNGAHSSDNFLERIARRYEEGQVRPSFLLSAALTAPDIDRTRLAHVLKVQPEQLGKFAHRDALNDRQGRALAQFLLGD